MESPHVLDKIGVLLVFVDSNGAISYLNAAASEYFATKLDDARGKPIWTLASVSASAGALESAITRCLACGQGQHLEIECSASGGEQRVCVLSISVAEAHDAAPRTLIASGMDITDSLARRDTDRARLESLLVQAPDGIFVANLEGRYIDVNDAGCRMLGYSRGEILGKTILDLIPPDQADRLWMSREQLIAGQTLVDEWQLRNKQGVYVPVEVSAKILPDGRWQGFVRDITARQRLEAALRETLAEREQLLATLEAERRMLRTMLDIAPLGLLFFKPDGTLFFNRRAEEVLGIELSPTGDSAQYAHTVRYPDGRLVPREELVSSRVLVNGATVIAEEFAFDRPDGTRIPVLGSAAPLHDAQGRVVGGVGVFQDISERMQAEQALRTSNERFRVSLQSVPVAVWNQDRELRYTWVHNLSAPLTSADVLGKTDFELLPPDLFETVVQIKRRVLETGVGARSDLEVVYAGETRFYDLRVEPLRDHAGETIGITCAAWNITEQKRVEQRQRFLLEAGRVLLGARLDVDQMMAEVAELAIRSLADVCVVDVIEAGRWRRLHVRQAHTIDSGLGKRLQAVDIDKTRRAMTSESLAFGRAKLVTNVTDADLREIGRNDEHVALLQELGVQSFLSVPLSARGEIIGAFAIVSTSPTRRYYENELVFAREFARLASLAMENAQLYGTAQRASAARDEVLAIAAHDLRTPINVVRLNLDVMTALPDDLDQRTRSTHSMRQACDRMTRLVEDMLDVTLIEAGTLRMVRMPVVTSDVLDEVIKTHEPAAMKASLQFRWNFSDQLPDVLGDRDRLLQVFDNLISNAIKFTPAGGTITVGSESRKNEILMWVADSGQGMSTEQATHVFDRFWRVNRLDRRGAGLGLAIVKGIIEGLGGRVWVASEPGNGSTFYFTLPRSEIRLAPHLAAQL